MKELAWIAEARQFIGLKEKTGRNDHPLIDAGWVKYGYKWLKGQPWCGLIVMHCLSVANRYTVPLWFRALSWQSDKMTKLEQPAYGCIVIMTRQGGGHVAFIVGQDERGNIMLLGGNQNNQVSIAPFAKERISGYYWPSKIIDGQVVKSRPYADRYKLPLLTSDGKVSTNEA